MEMTSDVRCGTGYLPVDLVEVSGFEPLTSSLRTTRSTN